MTMIKLSMPDIHMLSAKHKVSLVDFRDLNIWLDTFQRRLNLAYAHTYTLENPPKFSITGHLLNQVCQESDLEDQELLDVTRINKEQFFDVRLGKARISYFQLQPLADAVFSHIEDSCVFQSACLMFFYAVKHALMLDAERGMLSEFNKPIEDIFKSKASRRPRRPRVRRRIPKRAPQPS